MTADGPSSKTSHSGRSAARLAAVQALYQIELTGISPSKAVAEFVDHRLGKVVDGVDYEQAVERFTQAVGRFRYKAEIWVYLARAHFYTKSPSRARATDAGPAGRLMSPAIKKLVVRRRFISVSPGSSGAPLFVCVEGKLAPGRGTGAVKRFTAPRREPP